MKLLNISPDTTRSARESNGELLRLIAMLMIVTHHWVVHAVYPNVLKLNFVDQGWDTSLALGLYAFGIRLGGADALLHVVPFQEPYRQLVDGIYTGGLPYPRARFHLPCCDRMERSVTPLGKLLMIPLLSVVFLLAVLLADKLRMIAMRPFWHFYDHHVDPLLNRWILLSPHKAKDI